MTDAQFIAWLKDSTAIRCALVEVNVKSGGVETTRYLSNKGYVTKPTDTPANTHYSPYIAGGIKFTETLSLEGNAGLSFGDIEIDNMSGDRDEWLNDVWANRSIKVYIGDVRWARSDFRLIFDGMVVSVDTRNRTRINLRVGDKMIRLNTPVTEAKLGGSTPNADRLKPLCFGECHNVEPLLVDPAVNEYMVHDGPIESIIEVRDNGVPVAFTPFLTTGKFRLNAQPSGQVTASIQGMKATELLSPEKVVNGTFDGDLDNWVINLNGGTGSVEWSQAGAAIAGDGTNAAQIGQQITTIAGYKYKITFDIVTAPISVMVGTNGVGSTTIASFGAQGPGTGLTLSFVASGTSAWVSFSKTAASPVGTVTNVSVVEEAGTLLFTNGDFSSGTTGWSMYAPATNGFQVVSGEMEVDASTSGGRVERGHTSSGLTVGQQYVVTGRVRRGTATGVRVRMIRNAAGSYALLNEFSTTSTTNVTFSYTFTAPAGDWLIQLWCESAGTGYFDNIEVRPTANKLLNTTFETDATSWTGGRATLSVVSSKLRVTNTGSDGSAMQTVPTVNGRVYKFTVTVSAASVKAGVQIRAGTLPSGVDAWTLPNLSPGTYSCLYRATSANTTILLANYTTTVGATSDFDNVVFEDVTNLLTNGDFRYGFDSWSSNNGALITFDPNGRLRIQNAGVSFSNVWQAVPTVAGRRYKVTANNYTGDSASTGPADGRMHLATAQFLSNIAANITPATLSGTGYYFTAVGSTTWVGMTCNSSNQIANTLWDNISVKEVYTETGYFNTVAQIVEYIVTRYGTEENRFSFDELDTDQFLVFDAEHPQPVGIYLKDRTNVVEALNRVAVSVGGRVLINRSGLLSILPLWLPPANLVTNGSFNTDVSSWTASGVAPPTLAWENGRLRISGGSGNIHSAYQIISMVKGTTYEISGMITNVSGSADACLQLRTDSSPIGGTALATSDLVAATPEGPRAVSFTYTATATQTVYLHLRLGGAAVTDPVYDFDDIVVHPASAGTTVTPTDIVTQSLFVSQLPAVKAAVKIGYCKNWTVQNGNVAAGVPQDHTDLYKQEWLTITQTDTATQTDYKTFVEPVLEETLLLTNANALAEANRRLNMYNVQRKVMKYTGMPWLMLETLGASQTIVNSRFGLTNGAMGQIVSLATDWLNPHITVEVLI